jgi:hypothetical protein
MLVHDLVARVKSLEADMAKVKDRLDGSSVHTPKGTKVTKSKKKSKEDHSDL